MHLTGAYAPIKVTKLVLHLAGVIAFVLDGQLPAELRAGAALIMAHINVHCLIRLQSSRCVHEQPLLKFASRRFEPVCDR